LRGLRVRSVTRASARRARSRWYSDLADWTARCSAREPNRCRRRVPPHALHSPNRLPVLRLVTPLPLQVLQRVNGWTYSDPSQTTAAMSATRTTRAAPLTLPPEWAAGTAAASPASSLVWQRASGLPVREAFAVTLCVAFAVAAGVALVVAVPAALLEDPAGEPLAGFIPAELVTVLAFGARRGPHGVLASVFSARVL
jgi:hypothetical protein